MCALLGKVPTFGVADRAKAKGDRCVPLRREDTPAVMALRTAALQEGELMIGGCLQNDLGS